MTDIELQAPSLHVWTDLHLAAERPHEVSAFASQVGEVPVDEVLLCLGDLFDAWTGPESTASGAFEPLLSALRRRAEQGGRSILLRGNRDVLLTPSAADGLGWELADRLIWQTAGALPVLFSHGDEYCVNDRPYQRLRRTLRAGWVRGLLRALPGATRSWMARRMRGHSQSAVARKPLDSLALAPQAAEHPLAEASAQVAVIGHLHEAAAHDLSDGRRLIVLPAWHPGQSAWTGLE